MNWETETNRSELQHYGVIGMKWGVHKAKKAGTTYTYTSHGQKKYEKKLEKAKTKGATEGVKNTIKSKLEVYKVRDRKRQDYAESTKLGSVVARGILLGPLGSGNYNRMRATGHTRLRSFMASSYVTQIMATPLSMIGSRTEEKQQAKSEARLKRIIRSEVDR